MGRFVLEWSDFSRGYDVGGDDAGQPLDSWRGHWCYTDPNDGMLTAYRARQSLALAGGSPLPTAGATTGHVRLFVNGSTAWRVYQALAANTLAITQWASSTSPPGGAVTITNQTVANVGTFWDACAWDSTFIYFSYLQSAGVNNFGRINMGTMAVTSYALPDNLRLLARWGEFMVGAGTAPGRRLWYSNAYDPTVWGGAAYYDVGDDSPISAIVPFGDTLYVGKPDGWWAVTGVFGVSTAIRKVAEGYPGPAGHVTGSATFSTSGRPTTAVPIPFGVAFASPWLDGTAFLLSGNNVAPLNRAHSGSNAGFLAAAKLFTVSPGLVAAVPWIPGAVSGASDCGAWVLDLSHGRPMWSKIEVATLAGANAGTWGNVGEYVPAATVDRRHLWIDQGHDVMWIVPLGNSVEEPAQSNAIAQAHLAEQRRNDSFLVSEAYVEVAWTPNASAAPLLNLTLECRGHPELPAPGRIGLTAGVPSIATQTTPPTYSLYHDKPYVSQVFRLYGDFPRCTSVVPVVTFQECKIRRVWLVCDTSGS